MSIERKPTTGWPADVETGRERDTAESIRDEAVRAAWDDRLRLLRSQLQAADSTVSAGRLLETLRLFEHEIYLEQRSLLATTLLWTEAEQVAAQWVQGAYRELAQSATDAFRRAAGSPGAGFNGATGHLAAFAFAGFASAMKWSEIADTPHDATLLVEIKRVFALVEAAAKQGDAFAIPHGESETALTLQALFLRALLLDAFCRGNLGQRQIEILDSWLWEWSGEYTLSERAEGAVLALDRQGMRGLRSVETAVPNPDQRYINIDALAGQIAAVVRGFREGQIFPGYGCAAEFRVEEHVATLEYLRRFLDSARGRSGRAPRRGRTGRLEAFVGLGEILSKGFLARATPIVQEEAPLSGGPRPAIDSRFDVPRHHVRLLDESDQGLGVTCEDRGMQSVDVGTLLGLQDSDGPPPLLCEVVRRSAPEDATTVPPHLGLRVISRNPRKLTLRVAGSGERVEVIFIPGDDKGGYRDMLLVSQGDFERQGPLKAVLSDRVFMLKLNRVRYHGNGWHLAGFEVIEEQPGGGWADEAR